MSKSAEVEEVTDLKMFFILRRRLAKAGPIGFRRRM